MRKKLIALVIGMAVIALLSFWAVKQPDQTRPVEYINEQYGFTLSMNEGFHKQVEIKEADKSVYFVSKAIQAKQADAIFGVIGRIEVYDKKEFSREEMMESGSAYGLKYLGENDYYYFGWAHATDVQVPPGDEALSNEFRTMEAQFDEIIKSFQATRAPAPSTAQLKVETGHYVGLADNNFFEVKISGVPEEVAARVFMISDKIRSKFENLGLQEGEVIKIKYISNEHGQNVLEDIERLDNR